ncbi:hypothetical protein [Demequina aurantiaca]|uniref:hypothetical protein n=1 Tax=Demequina aurantiaca TaxID=676200 RepID=UPI000783EE11|nr:hypothetical protein [Demequina aurantiaca]
MPVAAFEMIFGRVVFWLALPVNVAIAALLTVGAVASLTGDSTWSLAVTVLVAVLAVWWWVLCVDLCVLVLYRPRHSHESLQDANAQRQGGVLIPGSRRLVVTTFVAALLTLAVLVAALWAVDGGWVIVMAILVAGMALVVVDFALTVRRPRFLELTRDGFSVAVFRGQWTLAWDDVTSIAFVQGMNGTMVFRMGLVPGAASLTQQWRHPFARRKDSIDIEPIALDLDPLLLMLALLLYRDVPQAREELAQGQVPVRLTDANRALSSASGPAAEQLLKRFKPERSQG